MARGSQEVTAEDAAAALEVSRATIYNLLDKGELKNLTPKSLLDYAESRHRESAKKLERCRDFIKLLERRMKNG